MMDIVYFTGVLLALFFSIHVFSKKSRNLADWILSVWMAVFAVNLFIPFFVCRYPDYNYILNGIDSGLFTLHAVFLYMYTKVLIDNQQKILLRDLWHILPVLFVYACIMPYLLLNPSTKMQILQLQQPTPINILRCIFLNFSFFLVYALLTLRKLKRHKKNIQHLLSFTEKQDMHWISLFIYGAFVVAAAFMVFVIFIFSMHLSLITIDRIIYIFYLGYIFVIGHWGYRQGKILGFDASKISGFSKQRVYDKNAPSAKKHIPTPQDLALVKKLTTFMEQEKPYLKNELSLYDLANALGLSIFKISFLLNNTMDCNFYDLVNKYRVEEFKRRIICCENANYTLLAIALECGFNSKATFNRIFKNHTGQTPSEFKQHIST